MGNGHFIVPPHDSEHPPRSYYHLQENKKYHRGLSSNGIISIPNSMNIRPPVPKLLYGQSVVHKPTDRWQHDLFGTKTRQTDMNRPTMCSLTLKRKK
jgi:hypothetical protein